MKIFYLNLNNIHEESNWKTRFSVFITLVFYIGLWFFAIIPFCDCYLAEIYKVFWVLEIFGAASYGTYMHFKAMRPEYSLGGLVASMLFSAQILAHLAILWDSYCMRKKRRLLYEKFQQLDLSLVESKLEIPMNVSDCNWKLAQVLFLLIFQLTFWDVIISWTTFGVSTSATAWYWYGFLSTLALQFRIFEFLAGVVFINARILVVRSNINTIGERNLKRIFKNAKKIETKKVNYYDVLPFVHAEEDERQVLTLKTIHNDIFGIFQIINECYGWSLLAFMALYFLDFVINSYWIVFAMITQGRNNLAFLQNGGVLNIVIVMLWTACWHCQKSYDYSRQIGCLIFKLVKPLGNKRYNDLVTEFSLQAMHQQFVITAKEFFNLNLNLLGSMVAAIVTYLVILIQFMFTEKSNLERSMITMKYPLNSTTPTTVTDSVFSLMNNINN